MGRIARALTVAAERVHNVTAEPVADGVKYLGSKAKQAKVAVQTEHERAEKERQAKKVARAQAKEEAAQIEAQEAMRDLMNQIFPDGAPVDPEAIRDALAQHEANKVVVTEDPAPAPQRTRKPKASSTPA